MPISNLEYIREAARLIACKTGVKRARNGKYFLYMTRNDYDIKLLIDLNTGYVLYKEPLTNKLGD